MRNLRPLFLALVIAAAFYFYTSSKSGHSEFASNSPWPGNSGKLELTEAAGPTDLDPEEQVNVNVYKKAVPSVVNIKSRAVSYNFFYGVVPEEGQGTGFILDKEGHILTNYHVIANAQKVEVTLFNRKTVTAKVIGADRHHDLAIIQVDVPNLTAVTLGDSRSYPGRTESFRHRQSLRTQRHHDTRDRQFYSFGTWPVW